MAVVVDTTEVPPAERFGLWAEVSSRVFEPISVTTDLEEPFGARLLRYGLGMLTVFHMTSDVSTVRRTPAMIRADDPEWVQVMLQMRGRCRIEQDDRATVAGPGQLVSWQSSSPYRIEAQTPFEALIVYCPSVLLRPHTDLVCGRTAQCIPGDAGIGVVVRQYLIGVLAGLRDGTLLDAGRGHLAEGVLDLVRALYAQPDADARAPRRGSDLLRAQIREYIDAHLADRDLTPSTIAGDHFISRSYLDRLFEGEDAGVWETIRTRRLDRARRDLVDEGLAGESILEIATRWGFASASHFSRSFRAAYGRSPRDVRQAALPQA